MSSLNRLERTSDINSPGGRDQLHDTLDLITNRLRRLTEDLEKVKEADKIVRPVPIEEYPVAAGQIYTGAEGGEVGDITWRAVQEAPAGTLLCDGSAVSRTTYSDLFAKISTTYGSGNGSTTFNLPNLARRTIVGVGGTGTSTLANTVGATGGAETHTLTTSEIPSHEHGLGSHTHGMDHEHADLEYELGTGTTGGGPTRIQANQNSQTLIDGDINTDNNNKATTDAASGNTNAAGGGGAHNNLQPSIVMAPYIRFRLGPTDVIQTAPISWGRVNAQWRLDTVKNFPTTGIENVHNVLVTGDRPGAIVRITAASGAQSGTSTENKIVGVLPLPHNFRAWFGEAFRLYTKLNMTGCAGGSSATVTLKISDPITAGAYLATTYSRTLNESSGTIADSDYVETKLTGEDLGRDWRPGYLFRWELAWGIPKTFTSATLEVGFLGIGLK